jgi:hypothetical protein
MEEATEDDDDASLGAIMLANDMFSYFCIGSGSGSGSESESVAHLNDEEDNRIRAVPLTWIRTI